MGKRTELRQEFPAHRAREPEQPGTQEEQAGRFRRSPRTYEVTVLAAGTLKKTSRHFVVQVYGQPRRAPRGNPVGIFGIGTACAKVCTKLEPGRTSSRAGFCAAVSYLFLFSNT